MKVPQEGFSFQVLPPGDDAPAGARAKVVVTWQAAPETPETPAP